jgi:hypothetical protein
MIAPYLAVGLLCAVLSAVISLLAGASVLIVVIAYCVGGFVGVSALFAYRLLSEDTKQASQTSTTGNQMSHTPRSKRIQRGRSL